MSNKRDDSDLNVREEKFVRTFAEGGVGTEAVVAAGYRPKSKKSAAVMASQLLSRPRVAERLNEIIETKFPDLGTDSIQALADGIRAEIGDGSNGTITWANKLKCIELFSKLAGLLVQQSAHVRASVVSRPRPLLPTDETET